MNETNLKITKEIQENWEPGGWPPEGRIPAISRVRRSMLYSLLGSSIRKRVVTCKADIDSN
jgi:hypothetical protein